MRPANTPYVVGNIVGFVDPFGGGQGNRLRRWKPGCVEATPVVRATESGTVWSWTTRRPNTAPSQNAVRSMEMVAYNKTVNLTPSPLLAAKVRFAGTACCAAGYESRYVCV